MNSKKKNFILIPQRKRLVVGMPEDICSLIKRIAEDNYTTMSRTIRWLLMDELKYITKAYGSGKVIIWKNYADKRYDDWLKQIEEEKKLIKQEQKKDDNKNV